MPNSNEKVEYKIEYGDTKVFFFAHSSKSALELAEDFIRRNKDKHKNMKLYCLNSSTYGEQWIPVKMNICCVNQYYKEKMQRIEAYIEYGKEKQELTDESN